MGWDIKIYVEEKSVTGRWKFVQEIDIERNDVLMKVLVNIGNDEELPYISEARDVPSDASKEVKERIFYDDLVTWLSFEDIIFYDWDKPLEIYDNCLFRIGDICRTFLSVVDDVMSEDRRIIVTFRS